MSVLCSMKIEERYLVKVLKVILLCEVLNRNLGLVKGHEVKFFFPFHLTASYINCLLIKTNKCESCDERLIHLGAGVRVSTNIQNTYSSITSGHITLSQPSSRVTRYSTHLSSSYGIRREYMKKQQHNRNKYNNTACRTSPCLCLFSKAKFVGL